MAAGDHDRRPAFRHRVQRQRRRRQDAARPGSGRPRGWRWRRPPRWPGCSRLVACEKHPRVAGDPALVEVPGPRHTGASPPALWLARQAPQPAGAEFQSFRHRVQALRPRQCHGTQLARPAPKHLLTGRADPSPHADRQRTMGWFRSSRPTSTASSRTPGARHGAGFHQPAVDPQTAIFTAQDNLIYGTVENTYKNIVQQAQEKAQAQATSLSDSISRIA